MAANQQDGRSGDHGQGDVKNPATDGRLKQNRDGQQQQSSDKDDSSGNGQGRVTDPKTDGRLKQNQ